MRFVVIDAVYIGKRAADTQRPEFEPQNAFRRMKAAATAMVAE